MENSRVRRVAVMGVLLALAILVNYIEHLIPIPIPVVGMKLGLANIVILVVLYLFGEKETFAVTVARVILVAVLFGSIISLLYAGAGAICSLIAMVFVKRYTAVSIVGVSVIGAISHSIAQVLVAMVVLQSAVVLVYLPMLLLFAMVTGSLNGMIANTIMSRVRKVRWH